MTKFKRSDDDKFMFVSVFSKVDKIFCLKNISACSADDNIIVRLGK